MKNDQKIQINYKKILEVAEKLSSAEMKIYIAIANRINEFGFCETSNKIFSERFGVSERTVTTWIARLEEMDVIKTIFNSHKHKRQIYLKMSTVKIPYFKITNENCMSISQLKFHRALPERDIDCDWEESLDIDALIDEIKKSYFLRNNNMRLSSFKKLYDKIISGTYRDSAYMGENAKTNFSTGRDYSSKEMNSLFQDVSEIQI